MSYWPSTKAKKVFSALLRIGWTIKAQKGSSHTQLVHKSFPEFTWSFHDTEELGPKMLSKIAKKTGLQPRDL
ncbi:MAG: type II toxin-antitoxin system HicA family toxin [Terriglobales bacterium]